MKAYADDDDAEASDDFVAEECDFCSMFRPTNVVDKKPSGYSLWRNKILVGDFSEDIEFVKSFSQVEAGYPISWTEIDSDIGEVNRFVGRHFRVVELEENFPPQNSYQDDINIRRKSDWFNIADEIGRLEASDEWVIFPKFQKVRGIIPRAFKPNPQSFYYVEPVEGGGWAVGSEGNQHHLFDEHYDEYADAIVAASCLAARKWTPNRWKSFRRAIPWYIIGFLMFSIMLVIAVRFSG